MTRPRYVGRDSDGRHVYVSAAPGGILEALADETDVMNAHALGAVVRAVLDAEQPASEAQLAAFVPLLVDALEAVVGVAARKLEGE